MIMEKTLEPGQGISYNTYDSDVWMARDSRTGRSALINDSLVFPAPNSNDTVTIVNVTEASKRGLHIKKILLTYNNLL